MSEIIGDNSCIFVPEFDDDAKRILGRDISRDATLAYMLLGKHIGVHPAYIFQCDNTRQLILNDPRYFLGGQDVEIVLGNSTTAVDYMFERIEKVKNIPTPSSSNIELDQYNRFTSEEIKRDCEIFDDLLVSRGAVHPISWSRDKKFRELVRKDIELVNNIRYGKHLGALIKNTGAHLHSGELRGLLDKLVTMSNDTSRTFACDTVIAILIEKNFDSLATSLISERLHVLHWKAHDGHGMVVPLAHKLDTEEPHPFDPDLFWLTLKTFLGKDIVDTFLNKSWKEQIRIARELNDNPIWKKFVTQYISIVEMLAKYMNLSPEKIQTQLKECRPSTFKAVWSTLEKWEVTLLLILLMALSSGVKACFMDPGLLQSILGSIGVVGGGIGLTSIHKLSDISHLLVKGVKESASYEKNELKRILRNKLDMLK